MAGSPLERVQLDARPDRVDYRDRQYEPRLVSLPERYPALEYILEHFPQYSQDRVLDQGSEGACTGFGLAVVINYLLWRKEVDDRERRVLSAQARNAPTAGSGPRILPDEEESDGEPRPRILSAEEATRAGDDPVPRILTPEEQDAAPRQVSPRMLYRLARVYDEWPGEDYEGSSCRGAMKGWFRHGVCKEDLWPYYDENGLAQFVSPRAGWQNDAARRPLGAYYRVDRRSITDMQAALCEVGALYVSARVHSGWDVPSVASVEETPRIAYPGAPKGMHAFALVGYLSDGFIVQNSWGPDWGFNGFAILHYDDWVENAADAWVAVLGAPIARPGEPITVRTMIASTLAGAGAAAPRPARGPGLPPFPDGRTYEHMVVMANSGWPINRFLDGDDFRTSLQEVVWELPRAHYGGKGPLKLAIYASDGLFGETAAVERAGVLAPYFLENDIYPVFITWRTGVLESIENVFADVIEQFWSGGKAAAGEGSTASRRRRESQQSREAKDRSIEVTAENLLVKSLWTQMKRNAAIAARDDMGLTWIVEALHGLRKDVPSLEVHLVGHSAGSIALGHLIDRFDGETLRAASLSLLAPACTVGFAVDHFLEAAKRGALQPESIACHVLSDDAERADRVGPYGKSLLHLVSRALEDVHKMPLLGMEAAWKRDFQRDYARFSLDKHPDIEMDLWTWRAFAEGDESAGGHPSLEVLKLTSKPTDGVASIPLRHLNLGANAAVVRAVLERIRGRALKTKRLNLRGV